MQRKNIIFIFVLIFFWLLGLIYSEAAVGDGKVVYGNTATPTNAPKTRNYTVSSGNWSSSSNLSTANTTINRVIVKANPQIDEYVAGVLTTTGPTLYIYTYSDGSWSQSWSVTLFSGAAAYGVFDIEFEQNSGDCLVVYSTGATTNELAYRKRVDGVWDSSSTTLESNRTTGVVRFIELEPRPNSDEIALVFSDANSYLSAFIWDGSNWGSEPTSALSTNLDLATVRSFDVAYEQVSGDVLVAYSILNTAGCGLAVKLADQTTWTNTADEGALQDESTAIDLCAEPGSNYIGFVSISNATRDMQLAIWDGTDTAPFNFQYTFNNADTNVATWSATTQSVACGWAGSGTNRRAVFIYRDVAATTLPYYTWVKSSATWEPSVADAPATYSPPMVSGAKNFIYTQQAPDASDKVWVYVVDSNSDLWTFTYDASAGTGPSSWLTIDDGSSGNYAVEANLSSATGPAGGLAITSFDPTLVELISFKAETKGDEAIITWRTASEMRTAGFRLYRTFSPEDRNSYEELSTGLIYSRGNPYSGREYQYVDKEPLKGAYYILEEILANGSSQIYQPVLLDEPSTFLGRGDKDSDKPFLSRDGKIILGDKVVRRKPKNIYPLGRIRNNLGLGLNPLKIEVNQEGLYHITAQDLINAGWNLSEINPRNLAIFNQGREIPIYVSTEDDIFDTGDFIEFYGQPNKSRYSSNNVYWLTSLKYKGLRIKPMMSGKFGQDLITSYPHPKLIENNASYYAEFKGDEHWFFAEEFISPASFDFEFDLEDIATSGDNDAILEINLQGASRWGFGPGHNLQRALIYLNNNFVGQAEWTKDVEFSTSYQVPISLLKEGRNLLTIKAPDEEGELLQFFLLNWFKITYPRKLVAKEDKILFDSSVTQNKPVTYKVEGFSSPKIRGLAIKDGRVLYLENLNVKPQPQGGYAVIFGDTSPLGARYILYAETALDKPLDIYPDIPSDLRKKTNQADYIIITHAKFKDALTALVNLRRSQGLNVKLVDVEDIYDEFNYGVFSPLAIKDFLSYAWHNWQAPKPLFVLLVGDATFDYQDFWNIGIENLVPAYLVQSPDFGETVSDNWFVDFDGDSLAEMFIGRLPVNNAQQLEAIIDKIISYENSSPGQWAERIIFVSDNEKQFEDVSDRLSSIIPSGYEFQKIYLSALGPEPTRQAIINGINEGRLIFNYTGHSGITLLAQEMIFRNEDVSELHNIFAYPLFLSLNCMSGYFIYPEGLDSLSETMLNADKKGIIAAISPSGLSSPPEQYVFMEGLYKSIFEAGDSVLGAVHFKAKEYLYKNASLIGSSNKIANVINIFNLLGDPALLLKKAGTPAGYSPTLIRYLHKILEH